MKTLSNMAILASDTTRTKAYLQVMAANNMLPSLCLLYTDDFSKLEADDANYEDSGTAVEYFDGDIPILSLVKKLDVDYRVIDNKDVNSEEMILAISELPHEYLIYSGYGGYLLKSPLFKLGKKYLHVHAGIVPAYRGSTTAYYSIIDRGVLGATAFFLNEKIDEGDVICQSEYEMPKTKVDIDYIYEPYTRACELVHALNQYNENTGFNVMPQNDLHADTYYIIHPVLKHLAIRRVEKNYK